MLCKIPKQQIESFRTKKNEDDYPDIHQIPVDIVKNLVWSCPWFPIQTKKQIGAFYYKKIPTNRSPIEGINSIRGLLKVLGPQNQNPGYMLGRLNYSDEIKKTYYLDYHLIACSEVT